MADEAKFSSPIRSTLQFWVHLVDLLSILLRCNGFSGIQNAVVDHQTVTMTFFGVSLALGWGLELLFNSTTELIISSGFLNCSFCHLLQSEKWFVVVA